jgi:hypothetical protein
VRQDSNKERDWQWVPYDCHLHMYSTKDIHRCAKQERLSWLHAMGDSQQREFVAHMKMARKDGVVAQKFEQVPARDPGVAAAGAVDLHHPPPRPRRIPRHARNMPRAEPLTPCSRASPAPTLAPQPGVLLLSRAPAPRPHPPAVPPQTDLLMNTSLPEFTVGFGPMRVTWQFYCESLLWVDAFKQPRAFATDRLYFDHYNLVPSSVGGT